ncbi:hypothetical protein EV361DRAFT_843267 [Lentinula raphanica]|uniref:Uncharacterized protein n=1 Tax=Lentinula raphanica TaxID=153919 RepID=A0AA38UJQ9_9AGAR|nr:hypothetical protein F5878DRAFT_611465 [Lentinula raphanica]KAJ3973606.1 hypothetical protein EV361DRAFT_843267 [Lentinula raphanica]
MIIPPGEPKTSPKPQPIGNITLMVLLTTCTCCALFILWRRAEAFRAVISHQLKTITRSEGQIRLSQDDGPPAHEFLEDDESTEDALELETGDVGPLPNRPSIPPAPVQSLHENS